MTNIERNNILNILNNNGISNAVINTAQKMDLSVEELFYNNIIASNEKRNDDVIITSLLGAYGNLYATYYFNKLGYDVENEKPVYDKNGNVITKADVYFVDKEGTPNYCEVKNAFQIIDNMRNFIDPDDNNKVKKCYIDKDNEIIKYKNIGKKLIKQVTKLSINNKTKVNVIVFNGCYVDDIIREKLNEMGVKLITLNPNINFLYEYISELVTNIKNDINNNYQCNNYGKIA